MFDLSGKMALVTGASGGIGGAIARALHAQGAHVVLSGTREEALAALRRELGERASIAPANLSEAESVDGLVAAAEAAAGMELDILVSNAGVTRDGLILRMKDEDWQPGDDGQPGELLPPRPQRPARHDAPPPRADHRHHLGGRRDGQRRPDQLRGLQGRHDRLHQGAGAGDRQPRHHRQLRRAGLHREPDDRRADRAAEDARSSATCRSAGSASARTWRRPASIWPATRRPTSPARPCT